MKKIYSLLVAIIFSSQLFAQAPNKMSYQAVIRNSSNTLVVSKNIGMQVSILQGSVTGTAVYVERQTPTTNTNGLASIEIGTGTIVSGSFATINWANGPYFIKTETDINGGSTYTISGTSELMSVPYAMHAKTASNLLNYYDADTSSTNELQTLTISKDTLILSKGGNVKLPNHYDADTSATNELQTLTISKDTIFLSKGGNVKLPNHYDADTSATNELQILTISNDTLFLSNGGYVKLPIASSSSSNIPLPSIVTNPISGVTSNSATYSGRVTNANGSIVIERGILYSTSPNPNIYFNSGKINIGKDTGLFNITTTMSASDYNFLQPSTTYFVRAYAITENNITKYGNEISFTTLNLTPPTVSTQAVTNITPFSAKFNGTLTNTNGNLVLTRGFVVSTNANPTLHPNYLNQYRNTGSDVWVADASNTSGSNFTEFKHWTGIKQGGSVGVFNSDSINRNYQIPFSLIPNTQYYVRSFAFAENNTVTYGNQVNFTTLNAITMSPVSGITSNSATFGAIITNVDTNLILSRGVYIGNSPSGYQRDLIYTGNIGNGSFSIATSLRIYDELLIPSTVYYVWAYVELNGKGTLLGRMDSFTTLPVGQTGPGGGKVFFDKGNTAGGWRYLMAAPSDQSTGITWGCDTSSNQISGILPTVGSGETNTGLIVAACSGMNAAKLCDNLVLGGQNDWFLPSIDELYLMYKNLHLNSTGAFVNDETYWSSSAGSLAGLAERFTFYSSNFGTGSTMRNTSYRVRAVRAY